MRKTLPPIIGILALLGAGFVVWRTAVLAAAIPAAVAPARADAGSASEASAFAPATRQRPASASPRLRQLQAPEPDPAAPLPRPAVFGFSDTREDLPPGQRAQVTEIENRFLDEVAGLDPARPDNFRRRWRQAVQTADQDFRLRFGSVAYVQFNHDQGRDLAGP